MFTRQIPSHAISPVSKLAWQALNNPPIGKAVTSAPNPVSKTVPLANFFNIPIFESSNMMGSATQTIRGPVFENFPSPKEVLRHENARTTQGYAPAPKPPGAKQIPSKTPLEHMQNMIRQVQSSTLGIMGDPQEAAKMAEILGPHATFEDVLAYVMMKIAKDEENKVAERIQILENGGHPGMKGWFSHRAADLAGVAGSLLGGAAGAFVGGPAGAQAGAAAGRDVGKQTVNAFTGYNSEDSRQIQFEKLKHQMNKLSEFMTCISNILANLHATTKNTISNIRA